MEGYRGAPFYHKGEGRLALSTLFGSRAAVTAIIAVYLGTPALGAPVALRPGLSRRSIESCSRARGCPPLGTSLLSRAHREVRQQSSPPTGSHAQTSSGDPTNYATAHLERVVHAKQITTH